jgi:tetratricopeptide (TPR) repeat protein
MDVPSGSPDRARPALGARRFVWLLAIVVIVLAVNRSVLGFDWLLFDDDINILVNPFLGRGAPSSILWAFQNVDYMRRYLPLGWLGFDALLAVDGYNAAVFHAASWILTGLNAALAFLVFEKLCRSFHSDPEATAPTRSAAQRCASAALAALLWSLHPLRAENAGWISGLLYLGSTTWALAAVLLYLRAYEPRALSPRRGPLALAGALCYLASLLVYPVFLALPALLAWRAAWADRQWWPALKLELRRLATWWLAAGFALAMNVFARLTASDAYAPVGSLAPAGAAGSVRTACAACLHYLVRTVWPGHVAVFYGPATLLFSRAALWGAAAVLVIAGIFLLAKRATRRPTLAWTGAALISLSPFLAQLGGDFHASDRYAVLWLAVWCAGVALLGARLRGNKMRSACAVLGAGALAAFLPLYREALANWKNTAAVQAAIDRSTAGHPDVAMSFARPAIAFWWLGDQAESARRLREGLRLFPSAPRLAETEKTLREFSARWRERVGAHTEIPPLAVLHCDLGRAWQAQGEARAAAAHFARAVTLAPGYAEAVRGWRETHANESR